MPNDTSPQTDWPQMTDPARAETRCRELLEELWEAVKYNKPADRGILIFFPPLANQKQPERGQLEDFLSQAPGAASRTVVEVLQEKCFPALMTWSDNPHISDTMREEVTNFLFGQLKKVPENHCVWMDWEMYEDPGVQITQVVEEVLCTWLEDQKIDLTQHQQQLEKWVAGQYDLKGIQQSMQSLPIREKLSARLLLSMGAELSEDRLDQIYELLRPRPYAVHYISEHKQATQHLYPRLREDYPQTAHQWLAESQYALDIPEVRAWLEGKSPDTWARMALTLGLPEGRDLLRRVQKQKPRLGGELLQELAAQYGPEVLTQKDLTVSLSGKAWKGKEKIVRLSRRWEQATGEAEQGLTGSPQSR